MGPGAIAVIGLEELDHRQSAAVLSAEREQVVLDDVAAPPTGAFAEAPFRPRQNRDTAGADALAAYAVIAPADSHLAAIAAMMADVVGPFCDGHSRQASIRPPGPCR